ncbi:MAG TPA: D-arabinono-1,4-lactone oxidase [Microbacterium sp.]|uniref:D-arabinono-1,4-lactone oxidase n=1 Tax=Microbacterium sp. TaxID=51671 RepID=UPI002B45BC02|nr:D-arabinono-1,4-lactone oxidase [Microbacterium sp.]HKT57201.1 D-arabinono-1,4-lactone oxidase [Microbacterium sp.]
MSLTNWASTWTFSATEVARPRTLDDVRRTVASSDRIRAVGTFHSFNDLGESAALVSLADMPADIELDEIAATVRVAAQLPFARIAEAIDARGWALANMGSLPHISVGGATATATHGSGLGNGNLSTSVVGLDLVTADGGVLHLDRADPRLPGAVVHLGMLGVVTHVTLAVQPRYRVRQDVYLDVPWSEVLADPIGVFGAGYSVSVFGLWGADTVQVWRKTRLADGEHGDLPATWRGGTRASGQRAIVGEDTDNVTVQGEPGAWHARLPHFRFDRQPSAQGEEIQTEYFVDIEDASAALAAVRALADRIDPLLLITELRTVAADELWLSTAYRRTSLAIHFTWRRQPTEVAALLPEIEAALAPFAPRPHWGKWFAMTEIGGLYPQFAEAAALVRELDPAGRFRNDYTRRVLGL